MKSKLLLTLSTLVLSVPLSSVYASSGDWYVGGDLGSTDNNTDISNVFTTGACAANPAVNCVIDDSDTATRLSVGYNINSNFAVELGYADLGDTAVLNPSNSVSGASAVVVQDTTAISLTAIGKKRLGASKVSAFGKAGLSYWDSDISFTRTPALPAFPNQTQSDSGVDPIIGLGLEYAVNNRWNIRAGWDRYYSVGEREQAIDMVNDNIQTVDTDVDVLYVGATVSF